MTLKPIPGAPAGAAIPDFPGSTPSSPDPTPMRNRDAVKPAYELAGRIVEVESQPEARASVYDGQFDEQAIVYRTRAMLTKKGYRLEKLSPKAAEAKAKYGYGPYLIYVAANGSRRIKVVREGLGVEEIERHADELPQLAD